MKNILKGTIILLASLLLFASCSGGQKTEKTLTVWGMGDGQSLQEFAKKYETETGIKVEVLTIPWAQAHDKLLTAVASKKGPDVVQMGTTWVPEFAEAGVLVDLTGEEKNYSNFDLSLYFDSAVESAVYKDKVVGIPWYVDTRAVFYRTDILAEVGYPDGVKTWEDLTDASAKLVARGEGNHAINIGAKDYQHATIFGWQNGWEPFDEAGEPQFNSPKNVEAITYLKNLFDTGASVTTPNFDGAAAFADGTMPMFISGPWSINGLYTDHPELDGKWKVAMMPANNGNSTSFMGGSHLSIFNFSEKQEMAKEFVNWMTEEKQQLDWFTAVKELPARKDAWANPVMKEDPNVQVMGEQLLETKAAPSIVEWQVISLEIDKTLEKIFVGKADVKTALDELNKKAEELLGQ